jgi:hypothetical protein
MDRAPVRERVNRASEGAAEEWRSDEQTHHGRNRPSMQLSGVFHENTTNNSASAPMRQR